MEKFCYKGLLGNSFRTKFFLRLQEVSPLEDVRFREVPLYFLKHLKEMFLLKWLILTAIVSSKIELYISRSSMQYEDEFCAN